jgi:DNA-binding response OmpR family regulator
MIADRIRMTWPEYLRGECLFGGRRIRLGELQAEIVSTLLLHRGNPVSVAHLIDAVYRNPAFEPGIPENSMRGLIQLLRVKMPGLIRSSHGRSGFGWTIPKPAVAI